MYYVFMVDLKDSKRMGEEERRDCQARLKDAKNAVNRFAGGRTRVEFSSGDSLQGYADDPALALLLCVLIVYIMYPAAVHCGIGCGAIYVLDDAEGTNANDGPAYHDALACLERSKKNREDIVAHFGIPADNLIGRLLASVQLIKERNTTKQNLYLIEYCLAMLTDWSGDILALGDAGNAAEFCERGDMVGYLAKRFETSAKNVYGMLKKSSAYAVYLNIDACVGYLSTTEKG